MLPLYLRDVVPHWNLATIDVIYECSECGTEVRTTVTKPTQRNEPVSAGAVTKPISDRSPQSARPLRTARALV
jgi:hypothetical protein